MKPSQKEVTVNENKYTLQKLNPKAYMQMRDKCKMPNGHLSEAEFYDECLKSIVVAKNGEPCKLEIDDFDDFWEIDELIKEVIHFQQGKPK